MAAARSPPRSDPEMNQDFRPRAIPRSSRSAALLVKQMRPSREQSREDVDTLEHAVHGLGDFVVTRELGSLPPHPIAEIIHQRRDVLAARGHPRYRRQALDRAF